MSLNLGAFLFLLGVIICLMFFVLKLLDDLKELRAKYDNLNSADEPNRLGVIEE